MKPSFIYFILLFFLSNNLFSQTSILDNGEWFKIAVFESGVFKIDKSFFEKNNISIDNVDPKKILRNIKIPIQGGLDPKILLTDKENLKKEASNYLEIFKDHPYIFNLGHGVLPETNPEMVKNLVQTVKEYK